MSDINISKEYGIPPRTPRTTALWAHLLHKEPLPDPPHSEIVPPPLAPKDKNNASMRVLLYDTQGHLEQFSRRVEELCAAVESTRHEVTTVNTLFQNAQESLGGDILDLVNRSQTHILKAVGEPAQAARMEQLSKDIDRRMEALDKRVDAMQSSSQSQVQALQTQAQALHALQDQQTTIIAALMPLLPLLQAIPLHIESARNNITEAFTKSTASSACSHPCTKTPTHRKPLKPTTSSESSQQVSSSSPAKRSSSTLCSPFLSHKRPRVESEVRANNLVQIVRTPNYRKRTDSIPGQGSATSNSGRKTPIHIHRRGSVQQALLASISRPSTGIGRQQITNMTPRRALGDGQLDTHTNTDAHIPTQGLAPHYGKISEKSIRTVGPPPLATCTPKVSREHSIIPQSTHQSWMETTVAQTDKSTGPSFLVPAPDTSSRLPLTTPSTNRILIDHNGPGYQVQENTDRPATPRLVPTAPSSPKYAKAFPPRHPRLMGEGINSSPHPWMNVAITQDRSSPGNIRAGPTWVKPVPVFKGRERRSPFKQGRRFIPLADSDEEDEEDEDEELF